MKETKKSLNKNHLGKATDYNETFCVLVMVAEPRKRLF
jgi:hypothetical protein